LIKKLKESSFFANWKTPKEGNYVSNSEFVNWCLASMGLGGWKTIFDNLAINIGPALFCSLIFQLRLMDIYAIGIMNLVFGYITLPLGPYITDNMGRFPKKVTRAFLLGGTGILLLAGLLWAMPANTFLDGLMPDFLKHVSLRLLVLLGTAAVTTLMLRWFGAKYGKFKPFMVFYGPLLLLLIIILVNIPYQNMSYSRLLLLADLTTLFIGGTATQYSNDLVGFANRYGNVQEMQGRMSPDSQERSRIMSVAPIFTGFLRSIFGIVFPMLATLFGGVEHVRTYKVIYPIYAAICLAQGLLVLRVQERVVQEKGHVARAKFGQTLKDVFSNKYQWIKSFADAVGMGPNVQEGMITWTYIYATRMPWAYGLMFNLAKLPTSFTGQLSAQVFTKRFSKRQNMVGLRIICAGLAILLLPAMNLIPQGTAQIALLMVLTSLKTYFVSAHDVINNTITADIWDYQQWKSGERLEASMGGGGYFRYVTGPLQSLAGFVLPFFLNRAGLFGDMDVLYDSEVMYSVLTAQIWVVVGLTVVSALPYLLYDLTPKKMEQIGSDLKARAEAADREAETVLEGGVTV